MGYYSAAVIDFDGNSIEAVYRPTLIDKTNQPRDVKTVVSRTSTASSPKAPTTVSKAKTMVSVKSHSVVSQAKTAASVRSPSVVSQAKTAVASQVKSVAPGSCVSTVVAPAPAPAPEATAPKPQSQGEVLETLINEARNAANLALNLVNTVRPNLTSSATPLAAPGLLSGINADHAAGGAIVGTLIGVAAGAALQYAFSNRSKENHAPDPPTDDLVQPNAVDRSFASPEILRLEYSSAVGASAVHYPAVTTYQAIEPAPTLYTYNVQSHYETPRPITMLDNDPPKSDAASTIKPPASSHVSRKKSVDSGFGPGPRDIDVVSTVSSKASRQSKKSTKAMDPPPTSYRAPTVLTTAETQMSKRSGSRSGGIKLRSESISRVLSSVTGRNKEEGRDHPPSTTSRARSQSRHTERSRRSRKDDWDDEEAKTVVHVTVRHASNHPSESGHVRSSSKAGSRAPSRSSSKHSHRHHNHLAHGSGGSNVSREAHMYPLPPSRAATWAGGSESGSFVSARTGMTPSHQHHHHHGHGIGQVAAPRTIIGRLTSRNLSKQGRGTVYRDFAEAGSESMVSKKKEMEGLDVSSREVRPEDSISQVSVGSGRGRSMRSSSRRG